MGEHHGVDEADAPGKPRRDRIGECREHAGPEEEQACGRQRQVEALEQPERQQRLHDQAARKGIQAEQRGELVDSAARRSERRAGALLLGLRVREPSIEQGSEQAERGVAVEHRLERCEPAETGRHQEIRRRSHQRSCGGRERAGEAVAGEGARAIVVGNAAGQHRVLDRDQNAAVTGVGIDRANKCHQQHERDVRPLRECDAGRHHQGGAKQQHGAQIVARRHEACHQRQQRRAKESRGGHDPDLGRAQADRRQIGRQDDDRKAVGEAAYAACGVEQKHFGADVSGTD